MPPPSPHLFDQATRVTAGDSRWQGRTSPDYWAFIGPFGGATAATILRALIEHPQASGDPLSLTVNYCAPIAEGPFDLDLRLVKANRSSQHWCVELSQGGADVATLVRPYPEAAASWVKQYDFRFIEGYPEIHPGARTEQPGSAFSKLWIGDRIPRKIDMLSLMAMSDAFFARIFHVRHELVPVGTVSLTTYFHTNADDLAGEDITRVLAVTDARTFHRSYADQPSELWSPSGRLLATTTQIAYFKA